MSDNFKIQLNNYYEDLSVLMLNMHSNIIKYSRNNLNSNDFDIIGIDNENEKILVDVQYSFNFKKYNDIRIDLMSAGEINAPYKNLEISELNKIINSAQNKYSQFKNIVKINKKGKFFDERLSGVFYLIYDGNNNCKSYDDYKKLKINKVFFLPQILIKKEIEDLNNDSVLFKINNKKKNNIIENYQSAFLCVNLIKLANKYNLPIIEKREDLWKINKIIQTIHNFNIKNNNYKKHTNILMKNKKVKI